MSTEKTTEHHFEFDDLKAKLEGVGKDAEIVTNDKGGKQSKAPMAMHLIDPQFLMKWAGNKADELEYHTDDCDCYAVDNEDMDIHNCYRAIEYIARFMENTDVDNIQNLQWALDYLCGDSLKAVTRIAKVLQYGASRYAPNNWRLIPQEQHINHALIHLVAHLMGDTQDDHLDHALCRLMMAYATETSEGFDYNKYIPTAGTIVETATSHPDFKSIVTATENYTTSTGVV